MVTSCHASFVLAAFGLYLGLSLDRVEAASCPAARINASEVCDGVGRNDIKGSPNLTHVVCDNFQNLSQVNRTFIIRALEFGLRKAAEVPQNIVQLLISQVDGKELEGALEEFNHKIVNSSLISDQWKTTMMKALWDEKLRNEDRFSETAFVTSWFQERLRPFLSVISTDILQCLHNETMQCAQYQAIVKGLDVEFTKMSPQTREDVFNSFQILYLKGLGSDGTACTEGLDAAAWLTVNFGRFSRYAKYQEFVALNRRFDGLDVLKNLTVKQLGQLSATEGALKTPGDVQNLMRFIETSTLTEYVDEFNRQADVSLPMEIQASLLEHVLAAVQPILQKVEDAEFLLWMEQRLPALISGLNSPLVPLLFGHLETRNCSAVSAVTTLLNSSIDEFSHATRRSIYETILGVTSNSSLRCYAPNSSFVVFLEETFQGFADLLTLRDLEALIPISDFQKIVNTIAPDALADLFSRERFLSKDSFLTAVLENYKRNGAFIDKFNQKGMIDILPNDTKSALLAGVWHTAVTSSDHTEVDVWLDRRLAPYFTFLSGSTLNTSETLNASCVTFRKIVNKLNKDAEMFKGREEEVYYSIKAYLKATETKPRCYNSSDPETSDWLVTYLGNYIRYSSARDMRLLTNNSMATFQGLALNPDNLELITRTRIQKDLAEMYAAALFAVDPEFSLDSLPDQLICFARHSSLISRLSPAEALSLVARVNRHCGSSKPAASDRQLATMLVAQFTVLDGQTLAALGQQAVGLTAGQILNLTTQDLADPKVLGSLGQVNGWSRGQSQMLVNKVLQGDFTLDTAEKFGRLGALVQGLPTSSFRNISADLAIGLAKNASFLAVLGQAPEHLRKAFVYKILSSSSSPSDILNNVPDELADQVPNSLLAFQGNVPDLRKINEKRWSPQQAAIFFGYVLSSTDNYTELSPFILQGFQCNAASKLTPGQLYSLAKEVKVKRANLSDEQLSCMAKLLNRSNLTANFTSYSPDVLLYFPLDKVENASCKAFYGLASQGNLSLLVNGSSQRSKLLEYALNCFGVANASLRHGQLQNLGALVCEMKAATIERSDPGILESLKLCPDLTASQQTALNTLLTSGNTLYGTPESWDEGTLEGLGPLALYLNRTTWDAINLEERTIFLRTVADEYDSQSASQRKKTVLFLQSVGPKPASAPRAKRATETCQSAPITASTLEDPLFIILYDSTQQFDACLSNEVLKATLAPLLEQPLPNDYLAVIKRKLDEIYHGKIPEDQLKLLGFLTHLYTADEIGEWIMTSSDTLAALLSPVNGPWEPAQLRRLVARYTELGGNLTGPVLDVLEGKYLCFLDENQLKQIKPEAIRHAEKLDISSCSQGKKDLLYEKAHIAFASQEGSSAYYPLIQPYLGGAPAEDLQKLARSQVAMDINTFINLKPEELQELSVQDVRSLLGINLPDLKEVQDHPSATTWIKSHPQSELDTLGIGLQGGMAPPVATKPSGTPTAGTPLVPALGSTVSATSNAATPSNTASVFSNTTVMRLGRAAPPAATDYHSSPFFQSTVVAGDTSAPVHTTSTAVPTIAADPRAAFPTDAVATSSNAAAVSDGTIRGTPAVPAALATDTNGRTSDRTTAESNKAGASSTTPPSISTDSTLATTFSDVTAALGVTSGRSPAMDVTTATPVEATEASSIAAARAPGATTDFTTTTPVEATEASSIVAARTPGATTDFTTTTPVEATEASSIVTARTPGATMDFTTTTPIEATEASSIVAARTPGATTDFTTTTPVEATEASSIVAARTPGATTDFTTTPVEATEASSIVAFRTPGATTDFTTMTPVEATEASSIVAARTPGATTDFTTTTPVEATEASSIVVARTPGATTDFTTTTPVEATEASSIVAARTPGATTDFTTTTPVEATEASSIVAARTPGATTDFTTTPVEATEASSIIASRTPGATTDFTTMTPVEATEASSIVAARTPGATTDFTTTTPVEATEASSIVAARTPGATTDFTTTTLIEATEASSIVAGTDSTILSASATDPDASTGVGATVSRAPAVSTNRTFSAHEITSDANVTASTVPRVTVTSSGRPPLAPPQPMPNATAPASVSTAANMMERPPASSKTTTRLPETSPKAAIPPGATPSQKTMWTTAATRRTSSRAPPKTKPPSYSTPNGYINIQPLSGSASSRSLCWLLLASTLTAGMSVPRMLL